MVPIVLAVFANDDTQALSLIAEREALRRIFNDPNKVELRILENADFDYINETILRDHLQDRIIAFHYGGHSDGKNIKLINGNTTASGLALLFKSLPNLQLVFLNGCDTYEQSVAIQQESINAAILTTISPLNDEIAVMFADFFYFAFYHLNSLNVSFNSARARIVGKFNKEKHIFLNKRSIGLDDIASISQNQDGNKSLYVLISAQESYLNRTLLFNINFIPPKPPEYYYTPNRMLIDSLSNSIQNGIYINEAFRVSREFRDFEESYETYKKAVSNRNFGKLVFDVLPLLPFPLSFHICLLNDLAADWKNLNDVGKIKLLKRQIIAYDSLVQLLGFTLLSSFWYELAKRKEQDIRGNFQNSNLDSFELHQKTIKVSTAQWDLIEKFVKEFDANDKLNNVSVLIKTVQDIYEDNRLEQGELTINSGQWDVIKEFLNANESNNQEINYPALIITIREIFENNKIDPFITEYLQLREIYEIEEDFFNVHLHMQGLKSSINNGEIKKLNVDWLCYITEGMLSVILSKAGFIVRYKLTSVKNIEIAKSRLKEPQYFIQHIVLDGQKVSPDDVSEYSGYTDSHSMILARGIDPDTFTKFMTLSPFIIDENGLKEEGLSKPFFFSHSENGYYVYRWSEDPDVTLKVGKQTYSVINDNDPMIQVNRRMGAIKDEMDEFKKLIDGKSN